MFTSDSKSLMKKIFITILAALAALVACDEWEPVVTTNYADPDGFVPVTKAEMEAMGDIITIKELQGMYKVGSSTPVTIKEDLLICGKVSSSDESGNIYKSLYIQDETGGMEIKIGRYSLYAEYKPGQTVYVYLKDLTIGMYGYKTGNYGGTGALQVGLEDPTGNYETSYLELQELVDQHVFKGEYGDPVTPTELGESDLPSSTSTTATHPCIGELVTVKGLTYGNEVFALLYITYNKSTKLSSNRIFLSDDTKEIKTWALSKNMMSSMLEAGTWDDVKIGNSGDYNYGTVGDHREVMGANGDTYGDIQRNAFSVSQYFTLGSKEIQIRSSGYGDFADFELPADVLDGSRKIDATGILSMYQGSIQLSLIDEYSVTYSDTGAYLYE